MLMLRAQVLCGTCQAASPTIITAARGEEKRRRCRGRDTETLQGSQAAAGGESLGDGKAVGESKELDQDLEENEWKVIFAKLVGWPCHS
ncbi:hypothetical protein CONLIGDRAFT_278354 [Coniochaeta ligniaria NRRL 30616]|uniref:Uncharacterized protein n=1 Tax=Coniochaeta ligniaria NRRL 30616 TaxID=1408157 RepID=A0A1J7J472_9PEZI|nr:hypothetical protein CONLIGDRAFT_278354 [Coniochaeta ligniaria NRRL 30616]